MKTNSLIVKIPVRTMRRRIKTNTLGLLIALLLLMTFSGCRVRRPDDVLSPRKMEAVLYDYHLAQAIVTELPPAERYARDSYLYWSFSKNGITKDQFDNSLIWYTRNPKELAEIYKRLSERIEKEYNQSLKAIQEIDKRAVVGTISGDSVDIWYQDRLNIFNTSVFMNRLTFSIAQDTTFYRGDTLVWTADNAFVTPDDSVPHMAYLSLSVRYNDSISTVDTILRENGRTVLTLNLDSAKAMTSITGSINYLDSTDNRNSMLVVSGISLMRYHQSRLPSLPSPPAELGTDDGGGGGDVE